MSASGKKKGMPAVHGGECNVTPLIDIIMCLIIFFMLVAKIGVVSGAEKIEPPETLLGTQIKDIGNTLILNVREVPVQRPGESPEPLVTALLDQKDTAPKEIKISNRDGAGKVVDKPLERVLKAAKKNNKEFKIIILAEQGLPYGELEHVLITCAMAGVTEINFKTRQGMAAAAAAP
jgi:biopolymer transport protein ExbD